MEAAKGQRTRDLVVSWLSHTGHLEELLSPDTPDLEAEAAAVESLLKLITKAEALSNSNKASGGARPSDVEPLLRLFREYEGPGGYTSDGGLDEEGVRVMPLSLAHDCGERYHTVFLPMLSSRNVPGMIRKATRLSPPPASLFGLSLPDPPVAPRGSEDVTETPTEGGEGTTTTTTNNNIINHDASSSHITNSPPFDLVSLTTVGTASHKESQLNHWRGALCTALGTAIQEAVLSLAGRSVRGKLQLSPSVFLSEMLPASEVPSAAVLSVADGGTGTDSGSNSGSGQQQQQEEEEEEERGNRMGQGQTATEKGPGGATLTPPAEPLLAEPLLAEPHEPLSVSFSSLSTYQRCPYNYFLQYRLKARPPPNPLMVYGRALHEMAAHVQAQAQLQAGSEGGMGMVGVQQPQQQEELVIQQQEEGEEGGTGAETMVENMAREAAAVFRRDFRSGGATFRSAAEEEEMLQRGEEASKDFVRRYMHMGRRKPSLGDAGDREDKADDGGRTSGCEDGSGWGRGSAPRSANLDTWPSLLPSYLRPSASEDGSGGGDAAAASPTAAASAGGGCGESADDGSTRVEREEYIEYPFDIPFEALGPPDDAAVDDTASAGITFIGTFDRVDVLRNVKQGGGYSHMGSSSSSSSSRMGSSDSDAGQVVREGGGGDGQTGPIRQLWITDFKCNVGAKDPAKVAAKSLQLQLYSIAAHHLFGTRPSHVVIESIEDGRVGTLPQHKMRDFESVKQEVQEAVGAIRRGEFEPRPGFSSCTFCGFKHTCAFSTAKGSA